MRIKLMKMKFLKRTIQCEPLFVSYYNNNKILQNGYFFNKRSIFISLIAIDKFYNFYFFHANYAKFFFLTCDSSSEASRNNSTEHFKLIKLIRD